MAGPRSSVRSDAPAWHRASPAPFVLVSGPEELLGTRAVSLIIDAVRARDPELDVHRIEAATYRLGQLREAVSPSLFGGTAVVVVEGAESMSDDFLADAVAYVATPDPDAVVVIRHGGGKVDDFRDCSTFMEILVASYRAWGIFRVTLHDRAPAQCGYGGLEVGLPIPQGLASCGVEGRRFPAWQAVRFALRPHPWASRCHC